MDTLYGTPQAVPCAVPDARPGAPPDEGQARRFAGVARVYGQGALERFGRAHIAVIGLGGVGTWAAEALARSGVGLLTLVDLDHISESNTNRQIHALDPEYGKAKVQAMAERIRAINPAARVRTVEEFVAADNVAECIGEATLVLDCIDAVIAKAALIAYARAQGRAVVTCGAAGGRRDPGRIRREDLARTQGDRLLARVRHTLRHEHGFAAAPRTGPATRFGVLAIYSDEPPVSLARADPTHASAAPAPGSPLACGGYGSAVTVTASMGFAAAAGALEHFERA